MLYFAYGSNLSTVRLLRRVPSAELLTTGQLREHQLCFHKIGRDGSAKCNAFYTGNPDDFLYGAVYRIDPAHKHFLDRAEGLGRGYETKKVTIVTATDGEVTAFTYYATHVDPDRKPFHWYREHVLRGAREHRFPRSYIDRIAGIRALKDSNRSREKTEMEMYWTGGAGQ